MTDYIKSLFTKRVRYSLSYILTLFASIVFALILGAVIMLVLGYNPLACYAELIRGAFGSLRVFGDTIAKSITLCVTGLAMAVAARAGMFNVGGEGQLYLGAMAAATVGFVFFGASPVLIIPLAIICAMAAGGLYAFIPAILKTKLNISEVITTIMLNTVAISFCIYLANGPLKTTETGIASGTPAIDPAFRLQTLIPLSNLTHSLFITIILCVIVWYIMQRTTTGYELKLTGQNPRFASYMGIKTDKLALWAMILSGAMCGLVGMFEVYGIHGRFVETVSMEFYFDGMLVAMIMRYNPIGIMLMSLFFGALKIGSGAMELNMGISSEIILIVQSIIIFCMAAENGITAQLHKLRTKIKTNRLMKSEAAKKGDREA